MEYFCLFHIKINSRSTIHEFLGHEVGFIAFSKLSWKIVTLKDEYTSGFYDSLASVTTSSKWGLKISARSSAVVCGWILLDSIHKLNFSGNRNIQICIYMHDFKQITINSQTDHRFPIAFVKFSYPKHIIFVIANDNISV